MFPLLSSFLLFFQRKISATNLHSRARGHSFPKSSKKKSYFLFKITRPDMCRDLCSIRHSTYLRYFNAVFLTQNQPSPGFLSAKCSAQASEFTVMVNWYKRINISFKSYYLCLKNKNIIQQHIFLSHILICSSFIPNRVVCSFSEQFIEDIKLTCT